MPAKAKDDLSIEHLHRTFDYDPATGVLTSKLSGSTGCRDVKGYLKFYRNGTRYSAHRIAWAWTFGEWPNGMLDHINGDRSDNRIENLRVASATENGRNVRPHKGRSHPLKGIYPGYKGKWDAAIRADGKTLYIGTFQTPEEAHAAYAAKAKELFGEFARLA